MNSCCIFASLCLNSFVAFKAPPAHEVKLWVARPGSSFLRRSGGKMAAGSSEDAEVQQVLRGSGEDHAVGSHRPGNPHSASFGTACNTPVGQAARGGE